MLHLQAVWIAGSVGCDIPRGNHMVDQASAIRRGSRATALVAVLACVLALLSAVVSPSPASAADLNLVPGTATPFPGTLVVRSIACPTATHCVAVAYDFNVSKGGSLVYAISIDNGVYGTPVLIPNLSFAYAVACMDASHCVVAGSTPPIPGNTVLVVGAVVMLTDGVPGPVHALPGYGYQLTDIACPSSTSCLAAGGGAGSGSPGDATGIVVPVDATGIPAAPISVPGTTFLTSIGCADATTCYVAGLPDGSFTTNAVVKVTNGVPGTAIPVPDMTQIFTIACSNATSCVAGGTSTRTVGALVSISGSGVGSAIDVPTLENVHDIACVTSTQCVGVGDGVFNVAGSPTREGALIPITSGVAGTTVPVTDTIQLFGVGCATTVSCFAGGTDGPDSIPGAIVPFSTGLVTSTQTALVSSENPTSVGRAVTLTATVTPSQCAAGNVTFFDGSTSLGSADTASGVATLNTSSLPQGNRSITATFTPSNTSQCAGSTSSPLAEVVNAALSIATTPTGATAGGSISDQATISGGTSPTGSVRFDLYGPGNSTCTGNPIATGTQSLSNGSATQSVHLTRAGTYYWIATYLGDTHNAQIATSCGEATVVSPGAVASLILDPATATIQVGASQSYTATGYDQFGNLIGDVTSGTTFTISGGGSCTANSCTAPSGTYTVTGHDGAATGTATLTVSKAPTATTLTFAPSNAGVNQAVSFTATVTPTAGAPAPITGTVKFFVDGAAKPAATVPVVDGTASFTTIFGGGAHSVVAVYSGDANYQSSTSDGSGPTVACDRTVTGAQRGLTITSGVVCLRNARISGSISVAAGAVLDLENSTVTGSISANRPASVRICGSHTGSITVASSRGFVLIGDPADGCAANTVDGSILVSSSTHGVVIVKNTVSSTVSAPGASGTSPLGQPVTVAGNHH